MKIDIKGKYWTYQDTDGHVYSLHVFFV